MKNKIKILFLSIFMLFAFFSLSKSQLPQCPDGTSPYFKVFQINGCDYEVQICVTCDPSTTNVALLSVFGFTKLNLLCNQTWTPNQIKDEIWNQILEDSNLKALLDEMCDGDDPTPPCDHPSQVYYVNRYDYICWEKWNRNGRISYYPCFDANVFCTTIYKVCRDSQGFLVKTLHYGPETIGDVETICPSDIVPPDPPLNEESDCWNLKTLCWPY
jgi:hypothetical protein